MGATTAVLDATKSVCGDAGRVGAHSGSYSLPFWGSEVTSPEVLVNVRVGWLDEACCSRCVAPTVMEGFIWDFTSTGRSEGGGLTRVAGTFGRGLGGRLTLRARVNKSNPTGTEKPPQPFLRRGGIGIGTGEKVVANVAFGTAGAQIFDPHEHNMQRSGDKLISHVCPYLLRTHPI